MKYVATIVLALTLFSATAVTANAYRVKDQVLERNSIEMNMYLTVQFPAYPDVEPVTASAYRANLIYWIEERGKALIRGEDMPHLVYSTADAPGALKELTITIDGMPGTTAVLDWTNYPLVTLKALDLRVRAYDMVSSSIAAGAHPIVDIILSDLTLSTAEVCTLGLCTAGYLDAENLEAQLVFATDLPPYDYEPYGEWLEGQSILGEMRIQIPNPFRRSD